MQLNMGKFSYNNNCGYLIKPEEMRRIGVNQSYDPFTIKPLPQIQAQTATVQVKY
jgi:phosphatidylinositol phospholipase C beta